MTEPDRILLERIALGLLAIIAIAAAALLEHYGHSTSATIVGGYGLYLFGYLRRRKGDIDGVLPRDDR